MTRDGYRAAMSVAMLLVTLAVDAKHQEQLEVLMSDNAFINVTRHKARAVGHSFDSDVAPPPVPLSVAAQTVATPSAISQHSTTAAVTALATIEPASRASPAALGVNSPEADPKSPSQKKKTKKKKKKAPPSPAPPPEQEQDKDDSWLSKDGRLTPVGASVWFAGGSVIGGLVLLLALRPPWGSRKEPAKKEAAAGGCTDGSWGPPPAEPQPPPASGGGCSVMVTALMAAIPSILGTWCWPLLLVPLFGAGSNLTSGPNKQGSHHMTLGVDVVLFGGLLIWMVGRINSSRSRMSCFSKWGPFMFTAAGSLMVTFDTVRHVLLDHGGVIVRKESLTMYKDANHNLSAIGLFSQWSAIIGLVFMFIGVSWVANIFDPLLKTVFGAGSGGDYYV